MKRAKAMREIMKQKRKEEATKERLAKAFQCWKCEVYYANLPEEMIVMGLCHLCQPKPCVNCNEKNTETCIYCGAYMQE